MREEKRTYWNKLIAEQEASGATIQVFCKQQGIGVHSFYSWRRRLQRAEPVQFALLKTSEQLSKDQQTLFETLWKA
ncbi:MAG: hypothetical protein ABI693_32790, partial [Bryobacteraceae bacterium]